MIERIGIIGGGQLGRMLTQAAHPLGFEVMVVDPNNDCPAAQVGAKQIYGRLNDHEAISELARRTDVVTWEIEHIPAAFLQRLRSEGAAIHPSPLSLAVIQDKLAQKQLLAGHGIPVAPFTEFLEHAERTGPGPYLVKTRRGGFDGRGNMVVERSGLDRAAERFRDIPVYVEQAVTFTRELAVITARNTLGRSAMYPVIETIHEDNICQMAFSPARMTSRQMSRIRDVAERTMRLLDGAGVFTIEFFETPDDTYLVNEIAPRVHNSGHLTIEANVTSQFEQHIRAITGLALGSTGIRRPAAAMVNIIGKDTGSLTRHGMDAVSLLDDTHIHWYGKEPKRDRKIGHITVLGESRAEVEASAMAARRALAV